MTVAPLGQAFERRKVMDFSYPIGYDIGAGVYRLPDLEASRWQLYLQPLSLYVHLCLVISFLLLILLLYTTRHCPMATRAGEDVSDTWLLVFGLMIRQSLSVNQMRASSNILFSFICVFGAITSAIYCSNMIAFFTVSKQMVPFSTSEEMVQQNTYKWGTLGGSLWSDSFSVSKVPVHQSFWQSVVNFNKSDSDVLHASELVHKRKVLAGKYVFVVESDILKIWLQDDCSLKMIPDVGFPMQYALGLPLHSPYTKPVSDWLITFSERGLYDVWRRKWMREDDSCSKQREMKGKTVTVIDLQGSFIVLGIGSFMAVVSLMSEIWWARVRDSKRN
ncbi:glutamate receptor ionotropic, kainate 2-like [Haliotis cracherodii]|uniref:glutamate receptor ionotropic, kainate 2-like n=1 Tax=Haliotis cracherodii TaxID=6455 RepID=UPI0039ED8AC6